MMACAQAVSTSLYLSYALGAPIQPPDILRAQRPQREYFLVANPRILVTKHNVTVTVVGGLNGGRASSRKNKSGDSDARATSSTPTSSSPFNRTARFVLACYI